MRRFFSKSYLVLFIILFYAPVIVFGLFGKHIDSVNYEQRQTAEKPVFSIEKIDDYPQAYEEYYNDKLPFRSQMIEINALINFRLFKQSPVRKVIVGKDGWLFYNPEGSDGDPIADYRGENLFSQEELEQISTNLLAVNGKLRDQEKQFVVFIAPDKECLYGNDYLADNYINQNTYTRADQVLDYLKNYPELTVIHPKKQLLFAIKSDPEREYYYKTDTHWNQLGSYIGSSELLKALDISLPEISKLQISVRSSYFGDLANMMSLNKYLNYDRQYIVNGYTDKKVSESSEDEFKCVAFHTEGADERSLFVIRDSFSTAMYPYLSSQFNKSQFIHINDYSPGMISKYDPDIVVLEMVERYIDNMKSFTVE